MTTSRELENECQREAREGCWVQEETEGNLTLQKAFWAKWGKFREDPMEAEPNADKEKELA